MQEAKAKDLALLRFRADLQRYAPELAGRFESSQARLAGAAPKSRAGGSDGPRQ